MFAFFFVEKPQNVSIVRMEAISTSPTLRQPDAFPGMKLSGS